MGVTMELVAEDREWLSTLNNEIWKFEPASRWVKGREETYTKNLGERRELTQAEWDRLRELIRSYELVCSMDNCDFGFGIAMAIYEHATAPGMKPEGLLWISQNQLPGCDKNRRDCRSDAWEFAWAQFTPFTHSPRNCELLEFYGMERPRSKGHYEY